jgi:aspartate-semialdehyde dehydrogenase
MTGYRVAIVGATGLVGRTILNVLAERRFPIGELVLLASERSAGTKVAFAGTEIEVQVAVPEAFAGADFAFFAVGTEASRVLVPYAQSAGAVAIDKSNAYRMNPAVPLVVPEVNAHALAAHQGIVASPNCTTIQTVMALKPLDTAAGLDWVHVCSYQAVSGSGREGMDELTAQINAIAAGEQPSVEFYPRQIADNVIPHIDSFGSDGYTGEERKLIAETRKILDLPSLPVAATAVRVPVLVSHATAVLVKTTRPIAAAEAREVIGRFDGVRIMDDPQNEVYPTPLDAAGQDQVLVGRIRAVPGMEQALELWIVGDNLRKGAATNAVQIAERLGGISPGGAASRRE